MASGLRMAGGTTDACLVVGGGLSLGPPAQLGDVGHFFKKGLLGSPFPLFLPAAITISLREPPGDGRQHLPEGRAGETLGSWT